MVADIILGNAPYAPGQRGTFSSTNGALYGVMQPVSCSLVLSSQLVISLFLCSLRGDKS